MTVSVAALFAVFALSALGWVMAFPIAEATADALGLSQVSLSDASELPIFEAKHAVSFGVAGVLAWVPLLVLRVRREADPGLSPLLGLYVAGLLALPLGMALRLLFLSTLSDPSPAGIEPMVMVSNLSLLGWGVRLSIFVSVMLCLVAWRSAKPAPGAKGA